jgi:hypothetical protein
MDRRWVRWGGSGGKAYPELVVPDAVPDKTLCAEIGFGERWRYSDMPVVLIAVLGYPIVIRIAITKVLIVYD